MNIANQVKFENPFDIRLYNCHSCGGDVIKQDEIPKYCSSCGVCFDLVVSYGSNGQLIQSDKPQEMAQRTEGVVSELDGLSVLRKMRDNNGYGLRYGPSQSPKRNPDHR